MINLFKNKTLLVVLGPTGVGKTDISLEIAQHYGCPIVSSDSRKFYRELKIGTAAPTEAQLRTFTATRTLISTSLMKRASEI